MPTAYLFRCDGCSKEARVEEGPFGPNARPDGWLRTDAWPGGSGAVEACSWACLGKIARARAKQDE